MILRLNFGNYDVVSVTHHESIRTRVTWILITYSNSLSLSRPISAFKDIILNLALCIPEDVNNLSVNISCTSCLKYCWRESIFLHTVNQLFRSKEHKVECSIFSNFLRDDLNHAEEVAFSLNLLRLGCALCHLRNVNSRWHLSTGMEST